jgi:hypothetical protein
MTLFPGSAMLSREAQEYIFSEVCFRNPWYDSEISSLVYEEGSRIAGFLGIVPRQMSMNGSPVRVAVGQHLMVDHVPLASMQLFRKFISGPQDLSIADMAIDVTRTIWERLGGNTSLAQSIFWKKPLRPATFALSQFGKGANSSQLLNLIKPFSRGIDRALHHIPHKAFRLPLPVGREKELTIETMLSSMPNVVDGRDLIPVYSEASLKWLFRILEGERRFGVLRKQVVLASDGAILGWYIYNLVQKGKSHTLQITGTRQTMSTVLEHLFHNAWTNGSVELEGRLDPLHMKTFADQFCLFAPGSNWVLTHSRRPELIRAINDGNVFFSRLEGDLWFF